MRRCSPANSSSLLATSSTAVSTTCHGQNGGRKEGAKQRHFVVLLVYLGQDDDDEEKWLQNLLKNISRPPTDYINTTKLQNIQVSVVVHPLIIRSGEE